MSKLSFRARALDPSKPVPIYLAEELPDLPEYSAINRAVPQMPSGMEKEEESEHHLQRAICTGLIIPTPEVYDSTDSEFYDKYYPPDYKLPKQLIHMQPLNLEQDIPDYDMDSSDEVWVTAHGKKLDLEPLKFEIMMDRLEKSSGQTVVTLNEAKALLKQDDEVSIAVYDYWLNKRLTMQHPLILYVKTENRGNMTPNNPYLAFRRRTEKMQTRKNRKNDESSYEKMLKLRRDLMSTLTLLEMIKRREKLKREQLHLSVEIWEKRYQASDFFGHMLCEFTSNATRVTRPAFAPIYSNQYTPLAGVAGGVGAAGGSASTVASASMTPYAGATSSSKRDNESLSSRKEKRQYKKRKLKIQKDRGSSGAAGSGSGGVAGVVGSSSRGDATGSVVVGLGSSSGGAVVGTSGGHHSSQHHHHHHHHHQQQPHHHHPHHHHSSVVGVLAGVAGGRGDAGAVPGGHGTDHPHPHGDHGVSSDDEELANLQGNSPEEEYSYAFRRSKHSQYHRPRADGYGNWPWTAREENGSADLRYRFTLTSLRYPRPRCIGFARRRLGRGGRMIIDRISTDFDDLWSRLDYTIVESDSIASLVASAEPEVAKEQDNGVDSGEPVVVSLRRPVERAVSVSSTCSNSSGTGIVVSLKPPRLPAGLAYTQPLVNGADEPLAPPPPPPPPPPASEHAGSSVARRKLVLKQELATLPEYDSDNGEHQFLASIGLMNNSRAEKDSPLAITKRRLRFDSEDKDEEEVAVRADGAAGVVVKAEGYGAVVVSGSDERTSAATAGSGSAGVYNSDIIVIKSEDGAESSADASRTAGAPVVKRELQDEDMASGDADAVPVHTGEDFEQLIDSVNSRNNNDNSSNGQNREEGVAVISSSISAEGAASHDLGAEQHLVGAGSSPSRLHDATREDIDAVYKDLLNDIQSNWLHFRPKTPEPSPDDLLTLDGEDDELENCLGLTDRNRITLELQALEEGFPATIFTRCKSEGYADQSFFRTTPFALDNLVEPHPLSLGEGSPSGGRKKSIGEEQPSPAATSTSTVVAAASEVKHETSSSEHNLSENDLNLSLNESNEDNEKMLDNILQECAIDDPKSLHQTSNFWNGILDDVSLNTLEEEGEKVADAGEGVSQETSPYGTSEPTATPPSLLTVPAAKIGYHSELVGYGRGGVRSSSAIDWRNNSRGSKRRKLLKRCSYLVGSSYFSVQPLPKEEIFQPLLDADGQPICLPDGDVDLVGVGEEQVELREGDDISLESGDPVHVGVEAMEVKMEEDVCLGMESAQQPATGATDSAQTIKIEPPDEMFTPAPASSDGGRSTDSAIVVPPQPHQQSELPITLQYLRHTGTGTTTMATIKLEPINNVTHSSVSDGVVTGRTGSTLIPATIVVSQPSGGSSSVFPSSVTSSGSGVPTMVAVSLQQAVNSGLHQLMHTTSSAPSTPTMLVMQSIAPNSIVTNSMVQSASSSPSVSASGTPTGHTSFLLSSSGSNALGTSSSSSSIAGSILVQASSAASLIPGASTVTVVSAASSPSLLSTSTPIVVTVPAASSLQSFVSNSSASVTQHSAVVMPTSSGTNTVVSITSPIVVSTAQSQQHHHGGTNSTGLSSGNSYIVQHNNTPIVLSHQQMQQLTSSGGGNIVTVGGQQVVTTKQHHGETYVLAQAPLKKQINGPIDGTKNTTATAVTAQAINNQKFQALLSRKLGGKTDYSPKQIEAIRKALITTPKMIVKPVNHMQQAQQQHLQQALHSGATGLTTHHQQSNTQYNLIHQNSPITIVSAQNPGQPTQSKIILTSSPQLLQQAGGATAGQLIAATSSHGKIQLTTVQQQPGQPGLASTAGGQIVTIDQAGLQAIGAGQQQKVEKNRIVYANIKNRSGQFLAQLNPKLVNIIQPMQQQKLVNSVTIQQQQQQHQHLHTQGGHGTTTIINSKGQTVQRIPTVSIRTQQQQQQQQQHQQQQQQQQATNLVDMVVVNNTNNIKFIQAAATAAAAAAAAAGGNVLNNATGTSTSRASTTTLTVGNSNSGGEVGSSSANSSNCTTTPSTAAVASSVSANVTNNNVGVAMVSSVSSTSSTGSTVTVGTTGKTVVTAGGSSVMVVAATSSTSSSSSTSNTTSSNTSSSNGGGGGVGAGSGPAGTGSGGSSNPPASINITNR